jgi:hypothetical protein
MVDCGEAIRRVAKPTREIGILIATTSAFVQSVIIFGIVYMELGWGDADDWACVRTW